MVLRLASEGRSPEAIADHLRGSAERRCARISRKATRQKEKGGRSHPSQTTIAEGHQGYRSLLPVCRSSPGAGSTARAPKALMPMKSFSLPLVLGSSLVGTARGVAWIRTRGENRNNDFLRDTRARARSRLASSSE